MYLHGWQCSEIKLYVPHRRLTKILDSSVKLPHGYFQVFSSLASGYQGVILIGLINLLNEILDFLFNSYNTPHKTLEFEGEVYLADIGIIFAHSKNGY